MRGVAAMMVVLLHSRSQFHSLFYFGQSYSQLITLGGIWVDYFFILSGFVLSHAYCRNFKTAVKASAYFQYLIARVGRLYPLHLATLLVCVIGLYLGFMNPNHPAGSLWQSAFLVHGISADRITSIGWNEPSWTISHEFWTALILPLFFPILFRLRLLGLVVSCLLSFTVIAVVMIYLRPLPVPLGIVIWIKCIGEFGVGAAIYFMVRGEFIAEIKTKMLASALCLLPIVLVAMPERFTSTGHEIAVIASFPVMIFLLANQKFSPLPLLLTRPFVLLGELSYSIYLNHFVLLITFKYTADQICGCNKYIRGLPYHYAVALYLIFLTTLFSVSWITYKYIEMPWRLRFKNYHKAVMS